MWDFFDASTSHPVCPSLWGCFSFRKGVLSNQNKRLCFPSIYIHVCIYNSIYIHIQFMMWYDMHMHLNVYIYIYTHTHFFKELFDVPMPIFFNIHFWTQRRVQNFMNKVSSKDSSLNRIWILNRIGFTQEGSNYMTQLMRFSLTTLDLVVKGVPIETKFLKFIVLHSSWLNLEICCPQDSSKTSRCQWKVALVLSLITQASGKERLVDMLAYTNDEYTIEDTNY